MGLNRRRLNRKVIELNVREAREQLEDIEARMGERAALPEEHLQVMLEHAYHHLNVAWHARRVTMARYRHLTGRDFNAWSKFPRDLEVLQVPAGWTPKRKRQRAAR
jgi:hypothetical protein